MSNNLSVSITADIVDLQTKFAVAQAEVRGLTSEMNKLATASAKGIIDPAGSARLQQVTGDMLNAKQRAGELAASLQQAGVSAGGFANSMRTQAQGVGGAFQSMAGTINSALQFTGIAVAITAIRELFSVIGEASQRANEIRSMSEVLGVTATQFQAMEVAATEAGIGAEQMYRAEEKLVQILNEARAGSGAAIEKLKDLGLSNEQIRDKTFDAAQMIAFLSGRLNDASTATAAMAAVTKELGARGAIAAEGIKQLGANIEDWNKKAAETNALSDEQLKRLHDMGAWWGVIGTKIENASSKLLIWSADAAKAVLQGSLAEDLGKAVLNPPAQPAAQPSGHAAGTIDRSGDAAAQTEAQQKVLAETKATNAAITKDTLDSIRDQIEGTKQGSAERLALVRQFYQDSLAFYANDPEVDKVKEAHRQLVAEQRSYGEQLKQEAEKNAADLVAATREKASAIMAEEGVSKAQQLAQVRDLYAQELLSATLTKDKRVEVERSLNEAIAAANREAASTRQAIASSNANTDIAIAKLSVEAERQALDEKLQLNQVNAQQKYEILKGLTQQEYALDLEQLDAERSTLTAETAAYEENTNKRRELAAKLNLDLAQLDRQRAVDAKKAADAEYSAWKTAVGEIETAETTMLNDLMSHRKTFAQSADALMQQMVQKEIENDIKAETTHLLIDKGTQISKQAADQGGFLFHMQVGQQQAALDAANAAKAAAVAKAGVDAQTGAATAGQAKQTEATTAGAEARTADQSTADAATLLASGLTARAQILIDAAVAAAGAEAYAASTGSVEAAVAAGAEMYSATAAWAAAPGLAVGAWEIPRTMQATLHAGESVLPRDWASGMRAAVGGGQGGNGRGQSGLTQVQVQVDPATMRYTMRDWLMSEYAALTAGARR